MNAHTDTLERRHTFEERIAREVDRLADAQRRAERDLAYDFEKAIEAGDPLATPCWAGDVADWKRGKAMGLDAAGQSRIRRRQTVAEVLAESLGYSVGPDMGDVLRVLSQAMRSTDPMVSSEARKLVRRAAVCWATRNTGEVMG